MKKMWTAHCTQCSRRFRAYDRIDLLKHMREHQWKEHRKWMLARMKAGRLAGGAGNPTVGAVLSAIAQGIPTALALIRLVRKPRWDRLETAVSSFEPYMKPEHRDVWQGIKTIKQIDIRRRR
ncbi:unnamed protein product [marine sediment metagenome]|uniref:Uncharacterized protein n=1 Tax=marine sediment metagenome TaxID=412755 RepID=X1K477_9ZZZZ